IAPQMAAGAFCAKEPSEVGLSRFNAWTDSTGPFPSQISAVEPDNASTEVAPRSPKQDDLAHAQSRALVEYLCTATSQTEGRCSREEMRALEAAFAAIFSQSDGDRLVYRSSRENRGRLRRHQKNEATASNAKPGSPPPTIGPGTAPRGGQLVHSPDTLKL